jgi:hypothetical protein
MVLEDNSSLALTNVLLAGAGILLGVAGVTLFLLSRRRAKALTPAEEPVDAP